VVREVGFETNEERVEGSSSPLNTEERDGRQCDERRIECTKPTQSTECSTVRYWVTGLSYYFSPAGMPVPRPRLRKRARGIGPRLVPAPLSQFIESGATLCLCSECIMGRPLGIQTETDAYAK
jgi:hypothetical protein